MSAKVFAKFHQDFPDVAIIAISRIPADEPEAMAAGAFAFLRKPVKASQLKETISKIREMREAESSGETD